MAPTTRRPNSCAGLQRRRVEQRIEQRGFAGADKRGSHESQADPPCKRRYRKKEQKLEEVWDSLIEEINVKRRRGDADDGDDVDVGLVRKRAKVAKKINEAGEMLAQILEWLDDNDMARVRGGKVSITSDVYVAREAWRKRGREEDEGEDRAAARGDGTSTRRRRF